VRYRHHGRPCKLTLGRYPAIDLAAARKLAGAALRTVAEGRDPNREKQSARVSKADTIEAIAAQFIERHCNRSNRPRTAAETKRLLDLHVLPRWRGRLAREITRRDVLDLLDQVIDRGKPIAANRTLFGSVQDVQLGRCPRHAYRLALRWREAADVRTCSGSGVERR
jgi:Arm DNA-binding domain